MATPGEDPERLKVLRNKRGQAKGACTRSWNFLNGITDNNLPSMEVISARQADFKKVLGEFNSIQSDIEAMTDTYEEVMRDDFEVAYYKVLDLFARVLHKLQPPPSPSNSVLSESGDGTRNAQSVVARTRLPEIHLPIFSGAPEEWYNFRSEFESLIHRDESLSVFQKYQYLRASLKGVAASVIQSLEKSDENYPVAWELLRKRFENKRAIVQKHARALFELPVLTKEDAVGLRHLLDDYLQHSVALKSLSADTKDVLAVQLIVGKLDPESAKEWERGLAQNEIPTVDNLIEFLTRRCHMLEAITKSKLPTATSSGQGKAGGKAAAAHVSTQASTCQCCKGEHEIGQCGKFKAMSFEEKSRILRESKVCFKCLKSSEHRAWKCSANNCKKCNGRHHTLLHREEATTAADNDKIACREISSTSSEESRAPEPTTNCCVAANESCETLLPTAVVYVLDQTGKPHMCRALLDSGSQANFISRRLADRLSLTTNPTNISIHGVGLSSTRALRKTRVVVKSRYNAFRTEIDCLILDRVTDKIPSSPLSRSSIVIPKTVKQLADPNYHVSAPVEWSSRGANTFWDVLCVGQIRNGPSQPLLQKTLFGWIIGGSCGTGIISNVAVAREASLEERLDEKLERFWQLEQCSSRVVFTPEETECEEVFVSSVCRTVDGRYIVRLPVRKEGLRSLGESRSIALRRLHSLERKFKRNPSIKSEYVKFMREYSSLGHMRKVDADIDETDQVTYYLPHHAVLKQSSLTTKLRVVFDASCATDSGVSLNDVLLAGPVLQQDLFSIVIRFRKWKVVLNADITKMYRQVLIAEDQRSLQRILWREEPDHEVQAFELNTITYSTVPASFLAVRTLHQLADDEGAAYSMGAAITKTDFYMDDLLTGANTEEEACKIRDEMIALLAKGGFELRKWSSNCKDVLDGLSAKSTTEAVLILEDKGDVSTLGIKWEPASDVFRYEIQESAPVGRVTKREILSRIARLFDPLGLLGPVVVTAKILLQGLWSLKIKWDESVPSDIHSEWIRYESELGKLNEIVVPRWIISCDEPVSIELHGFSDASEMAYGACVYARVTDSDGRSVVRLYAAKSRVAPLKAVSLPRLELCGALLLARLMEKVTESSQLTAVPRRYWTDSMIALCWLRAPARKWSTFVANRVGEIQELSDAKEWHHVSTSSNPADLLSRGVSAERLRHDSLWWNGPTWLSMQPGEWPQSGEILLEEPPEQRKSCLVVTPARSDCELFTRYSSLSRLITIVAFCRRFIKNVRSPSEHRKFGRLTVHERREALSTLERMVQEDAFSEELRALRLKRELPPSSRLITLRPFLDESGLIRVGGRLRNSRLPYAVKHPVVLPKKHPFVDLVIRHEHEGQLHAGAQGTLAAVRRKYWPLAARGTVRSVVRKCFRCCRVSPIVSEQLMGDLPEQRVIPSRPFAKTGVDYAGPFLMKESKRRNARLHKVYIAVFVCLSTKAIHLEVVGDLTAEAFVGALKRFISRRGKPSEMFSDNGTAFVGAQRELKDLHKAFMSREALNKILRFVDEQQIVWHFIPPRSPHFGGLWEAGVKAMKHHLKRVAGDASLTQEELITPVVQIEAVLNSRPICALSEDLGDLSMLTPGHFLIGDALTSPLEPDLRDVKESRLSRWQRVEQLRRHFWAHWSKEYLHQLQQRSKWFRSKGHQIEEGQLVIVKEDNLPPLRWTIARVEKLHPGADGVTRVATVKTSSGSFKRPAAKLCVLPV